MSALHEPTTTMFEETKPVVDATMPPTKPEELKDIELDGTETAEQLAERLKEERKQRLNEAEARRQLTARAKNAEEELKKFKPASPETLPNPEKKPDEVENRVATLEQSEKKRQFGHKHNLSPEETDKLFDFAGNKDPEEALKDPFFQAGLTAFRAQKRVENNTPGSHNRTATVGGKSFKEMTPEEREANWPSMVKRS